MLMSLYYLIHDYSLLLTCSLYSVSPSAGQSTAPHHKFSRMLNKLADNIRLAWQKTIQDVAELDHARSRAQTDQSLSRPPPLQVPPPTADQPLQFEMLNSAVNQSSSSRTQTMAHSQTADYSAQHSHHNPSAPPTSNPPRHQQVSTQLFLSSSLSSHSSSASAFATTSRQHATPTDMQTRKIIRLEQTLRATHQKYMQTSDELREAQDLISRLRDLLADQDDCIRALEMDIAYEEHSVLVAANVDLDAVNEANERSVQVRKPLRPEPEQMIQQLQQQQQQQQQQQLPRGTKRSHQPADNDATAAARLKRSAFSVLTNEIKDRSRIDRDLPSYMRPDTKAKSGKHSAKEKAKEKDNSIIFSTQLDKYLVPSELRYGPNDEDDGEDEPTGSFEQMSPVQLDQIRLMFRNADRPLTSAQHA
ncbi:hypothetical protein BZA70DRAFT_264790 [Myxozyma melibiosi]|uniref:Uncharacterized protein n=1 Tax=Myxozyma melibiosi TaxID=54550 RepID=A0ABR1FCD7_9ASCO